MRRLKTRMVWLLMVKFEDMSSYFNRIPVCDRQTSCKSIDHAMLSVTRERKTAHIHLMHCLHSSICTVDLPIPHNYSICARECFAMSPSWHRKRLALQSSCLANGHHGRTVQLAIGQCEPMLPWDGTENRTDTAKI